MNVRRTFIVATAMPFVITRMVPTVAPARQDFKETEKKAVMASLINLVLKMERHIF